jgi:UDP-galactopyranose mutase
MSRRAITSMTMTTGQQHPETTLVYEYPTMDGDPYYPIPRPENAQLYTRYQKLASQKRGGHFAGRLGTYKYYNTDQVTAQALSLYVRIEGLDRTKVITKHTPHYLPVKLPVAERKE